MWHTSLSDYLLIHSANCFLKANRTWTSSQFVGWWACVNVQWHTEAGVFLFIDRFFAFFSFFSDADRNILMTLVGCPFICATVHFILFLSLSQSGAPNWQFFSVASCCLILNWHSCRSCLLYFLPLLSFCRLSQDLWATYHQGRLCSTPHLITWCHHSKHYRHNKVSCLAIFCLLLCFLLKSCS